jgi:hypothetical protein
VERQGFIETLTTLYFGTKEERMRLIFSMYSDLTLISLGSMSEVKVSYQEKI